MLGHEADQKLAAQHIYLYWYHVGFIMAAMLVFKMQIGISFSEFYLELKVLCTK